MATIISIIIINIFITTNFQRQQQHISVAFECHNCKLMPLEFFISFVIF